MLKTQESCVFVDSILYMKRTFLTFIFTKRDVITPMTSNYDNDVIYIMTFCSCTVTVTRLMCDIYCMTVLHGQWSMLYNKDKYYIDYFLYVSRLAETHTRCQFSD